MGPDPDIYSVKLALERVDAVGQRLRNSFDLELLRHARRALLPLPLIDRPQEIPSAVFPPFAGAAQPLSPASASRSSRPAEPAPRSR